jgi:hypothetical protein
MQRTLLALSALFPLAALQAAESASTQDIDRAHWTAHPEPLYKAGGNPGGLDSQYAHKISLVRNPKNDTFCLFCCACGNKGRGIGLITSKPLLQ